MKRCRADILSATVIFCLCMGCLVGTASPRSVFAASPASFVSAQNETQIAYGALHNAELAGGNVSVLARELNSSVALIQKAEAENSTDPAQAARDLESSVQLSSVVARQANALEQSSAANHTTAADGSAIESILIVAGGISVFIYGERLYDYLWLYFHRGFVVMRTNE
jgi:hypothetical protein